VTHFASPGVPLDSPAINSYGSMPSTGRRLRTKTSRSKRRPGTVRPTWPGAGSEHRVTAAAELAADMDDKRPDQT